MALWSDINPADLTAFSRAAQDAVDNGPLNTVMPNMFQGDVKFSWKVNGNLQGTAEFGEFDTEAPIGDGPGAEEKTMRLIPVSNKLRLSEYEQVSDPDLARALADEKAEQVVRFIVNRLDQARAEVLVNGSLAISENGVVQNVDFGRDAAHTNATPSSGLWSSGSSDPIADLREWADAITDASGVAPNTLIMSQRVFSALAERLAGAGYVTAGGNVVSPAVVGQVLSAFSLPAATIYDGRVAGQRVIADDKLVLASSGGASGNTVYAPTVESRDPRYGLSGASQSGIIAAVYSEDDPPVKWVLGKAVALPVLHNPDTTLSADVL